MVGIFREDAWKYLIDKYPRLREYCRLTGIRSAAGAKVFLEEHENDTSNQFVMDFVRLLQFIDYSESYLHNATLEAMRSNQTIEVVKEPGNVLEKGQNIPFKYCYIFDYSKGEIFRFTIPDKVVNNFQLEEFFTSPLSPERMGS